MARPLSYASRIFKRLDFVEGVKPHPFFLKRMAYVQMDNSGNWMRGPMMCIEPAPEEYSYWGILSDIDHGMRYFMRPYSMVGFGCNEKDTTKSHLLVRAWLQHVNGFNRTLVTVERVDACDQHDYMTALNYKTEWETSCCNRLYEANELQQKLSITNEPYERCWKTSMSVLN